MATSAATLMTIIENMVETRPKTMDKAIELLDAKGLLPAKLLTDRVKVTPKKVSRFASVEAEVFAVEQSIAIPEGFVGSGKAGEGGKITIVDLRGLLTGKAKTAAEPKEPKEPKAAKAPKEPKAPKAPKAPKPEVDARITKKVRDLLHEWGLDESALVGCTPTAYNGTKFGVGDIAHLEPGLETGGKAKKTTGKGKAASAQSAPSAPSAPSESSGSDSDSDTTEEQDDGDFDPFEVFKKC